MNDYKGVYIGQDVYHIPVNILCICMDNVPFAHVNLFDINVGNRSHMENSNITLQPIDINCQYHLQSYVINNFTKHATNSISNPSNTNLDTLSKVHKANMAACTKY